MTFTILKRFDNSLNKYNKTRAIEINAESVKDAMNKYFEFGDEYNNEYYKKPNKTTEYKLYFNDATAYYLYVK